MKNNLFAFKNQGKICIQTLLFVLLILPGINGISSPGPVLFDMGVDTSAVWEGYTRVTQQNLFTAASGFGWKSADGLTSQVRAYKTLVFNPSRGYAVAPPIYTSPITEDAIIGDRENSFMFQAPAGDYQVYVMCGTSDMVNNQYYDFTVKVGTEQKRVQFEGGQQFFSLRFHVKKGKDPISVQFSPLSKWAVNAIMAWTTAEDASVQKNIIAPMEEWTYRMPPEEWAKWKLDPVPAITEPTPGPADQKRGFIVYSRNYLECVYPYTRPTAEDMNPKLELFATQGEYEPANFVIFPLKDLKTAKVTVSSIGPVPAKSIDVRYIPFVNARINYTVRYKYRINPDYLLHFTALDLKKGENARFWITYHVPENAPAGTYTGKVTFECSGGKVDLPVTLKILPIKLREDPSKIYGIYYNDPIDRMKDADKVSTDYFMRKAEMERADMVAHGTRNVTMTFAAQPADAQGKFTFSLDIFSIKMDLWKKYNFKAPIVMSINTSGIYEKHMGERYGAHLLNLKIPPDAFSLEITAMVKAIEAERVKRGWPEFLYYPVDEPGRDSTSIKYMIILLKACRAAGVRTYLTADPVEKDFQPLKPYVDVWCTQPFLPDRETVLADMKARNVEYWCYPNHVNGENDHTTVTGGRMTYGYGFWRSGFVALIPWIYAYRAGDPFNNLDGYYSEFFNRYEADGTPIPCVIWEAYREGYDDYRYIYTLEQLIAEAKKSTKSGASEASATAEKELKSIWDAINVQAKYKIDGLWAPPQFDKYRWQIGQQILALQKVISK
jgi:hypothetical protein